MGSCNPVPLTWEPAPYFLSYRKNEFYFSIQTDATYSQTETIWKGYSILSKLIPKRTRTTRELQVKEDIQLSFQWDGAFQNFLGTELRTCSPKFSWPCRVLCGCAVLCLCTDHFTITSDSYCHYPHCRTEQTKSPQEAKSASRRSPRTTPHTSNPLSSVPLYNSLDAFTSQDLYLRTFMGLSISVAPVNPM